MVKKLLNDCPMWALTYFYSCAEISIPVPNATLFHSHPHQIFKISNKIPVASIPVFHNL